MQEKKIIDKAELWTIEKLSRKIALNDLKIEMCENTSRVRRGLKKTKHETIRSSSQKPKSYTDMEL